jgi:hypothetical protein
MKSMRVRLWMLTLAGSLARWSTATVCNGEDLDVPTYLRRGVNLRK